MKTIQAVEGYFYVGPRKIQYQYLTDNVSSLSTYVISSHLLQVLSDRYTLLPTLMLLYSFAHVSAGLCGLQHKCTA